MQRRATFWIRSTSPPRSLRTFERSAPRCESPPQKGVTHHRNYFEMSQACIGIDGDTLKLEDIRQVAAGEAIVELSAASLEKVQRSRALVDRIAERDEPTYGVNTGRSEEHTSELQSQF